ncbi:DUF4239 domain-containing protein [Actinomadura latina]|uniref:DUF4239 domain-containing protein n=1 Tax=Actinomadura latina TaxID=163603 RepID=A0A846Z733_9ACTN|nr:DUF4239 domain-containing protein [Actinomadura latina]NKZ07052.1 DUF4239 domain-containing protein [Actinomadura latina]
MDTAVTFDALFPLASILVTLPTWVTGLLIIVGLPVLVTVLQALIRHRFPVLSLRRHNDVAGFLLAVIGVIYAVSAGFILIDLHDARNEAKSAAHSEALTLLAIAQQSRVMGPDAQRRITARVVAYENAVIGSWPPGEGSAEAPPRALERLQTEMEGLRPTTQTQEAFVWEASRRLMEAGIEHQELEVEAADGSLDVLLWIAVIISSAATLAFCLVFGLENARLHYLMVAGVTIVIAVNLFLIVELNYPFKGDLSVRPDVAEHVIRELGR